MTTRLVARGLQIRGPAGHVGPLDFTAGPGRTLALTGERAAGVLLATLAGRQAPVRGQVLLESGGTMRSVVRARAATAFVGDGVPPFPAGLRVIEVAALDSTDPAARLARFSLAHLARARADALPHGEARAVAMALALSSASAVVLLHEPLVDTAPEAAAAVRAALRDPARLVVFATRSFELARIADQVLPVDAPPASVRLTVHVGRGIHELVAELARNPSQLRVSSQLHAAGGTVHVTPLDADTAGAARAIARAALAARAEIRALHTGPT